MRRIPIPIVLLLCLAVIAGVWLFGARGKDFLTEPSATEIEMAKTRSLQELARPSDLFAIQEEPQPAEEIPELIETPTPERPPIIALGDIEGEPPIDGWTEIENHPASSFIDLASRLEASARLSWARVAWERVIDHCEPDTDERQAALKGILRTRVPVGTSEPDLEGAQVILLRVQAPRDRVQLSRRATETAATTLSQASEGVIHFKGNASAQSEADDQLIIFLGEGESSPWIQVKAPSSTPDLAKAILSGAFKLIASQLATDPELTPISEPVPGETPEQAFHTRITRLGWRSLAKAHISR